MHENKFNDFASLFLAHKKEYSLTLVKSRKKKPRQFLFPYQERIIDRLRIFKTCIYL